MTHHPHVHIVVPGGGLSPGGARWVACRTGFSLPVRVLSRLFRRPFLDRLAEARRAGRLAFQGGMGPLAEADAFAAHLAPLRRAEWVVYAERPFAGPQAVLAYLPRYRAESAAPMAAEGAVAPSIAMCVRRPRPGAISNLVHI